MHTHFSAYRHVTTCTDTADALIQTDMQPNACAVLIRGRVALFVQPRGVVCHAPQFTGFSRGDY